MRGACDVRLATGCWRSCSDVTATTAEASEAQTRVEAEAPNTGTV
jgi:hypothetical protein